MGVIGSSLGEELKTLPFPALCVGVSSDSLLGRPQEVLCPPQMLLQSSP